MKFIQGVDDKMTFFKIIIQIYELGSEPEFFGLDDDGVSLLEDY